MADQKRGWKQFQKLSFDSKRFSKRVKKAEGATVRHARKFILGRLDNIRSVRRHVIGWLVVIALMLVVVALQAMWFQQSYQTTAPAKGGTYAEAALGSIDTLNPLYATSSAEIAASQLLFSSLYNYDDTGHLRGDLVEKTTIDETGMVYSLKLRPNVRWHDGQLLTAKDVAFTVNLIKNPAARSSLRGTWRDISVKVVDDRTVEFRLPSVYAAFQHALTFAILPEHILGTVDPASVRENAFSTAPVGSGPFSFRLLQTVNEEQGQKVLNLAAFDKYYKGAALLSRFEIHSYDDQAAIMKALKAGEVNAASDLSQSNISQIDTRNYTIDSQPISSGVYAILNTTTPILKDKLVRQALQLDTDAVKVRKALRFETPSLDLPFINGQLTGTDVPVRPAVDTKKAAALLDEAGWKLDGAVRKKDGKALSLRVVTTKNSDYEKALEVLSGQWRELGIEVVVDIIDRADPTVDFVQNTLQQRDYDVLLTELAIGADPDVYAYWHSSQVGVSGLNLSNYSDSSTDSILASARARLEPELRNAKYKVFAKQWLNDVPAIGLYQPVSGYVYNKHVVSTGGSSALVTQYGRYSNVLYWSVASESVYKTP